VVVVEAGVAVEAVAVEDADVAPVAAADVAAVAAAVAAGVACECGSASPRIRKPRTRKSSPAPFAAGHLPEEFIS
jgi:hypothetical protein